MREAARVVAAVQQEIALAEQALRVIETKRDSITRLLAQFGQRRERLEAELAGLAVPVTDPVRELEEQLAQESAELATRQQALDALRAAVQDLQERQRQASEIAQRTARELADCEARSGALAALQARIGQGKDTAGWLAGRGLATAHRLWQALDVENGWEDALEAAMRERLNAIEIERLDAALDWAAERHGERDGPPGRIAAYVTAPARHAPYGGGDALVAKVKLKRPEVGRLVADALHGIRCRADLAAALAEREALGLGEAFVTPQGHLVSAQGVAFFAPDNELHGVLARQRELEELAVVIGSARAAADAARATQSVVESELDRAQQAWHADSIAFSSQQRRCHDLELELMQLRQAAEAAAKRRAQVAQELAELATLEAAERSTATGLQAELADGQSRLHDEFARRDAARHERNEAEVALARGRERMRSAERAAQEAVFAERSCRERLAELERRREALAGQAAQQQALLDQLTSEKAAIDWTPVEEALQRQLAGRGEAEAALAAARDRLEGLGTELRAAEEARLAAEQRLDPARSRIEDARLKEQAAVLQEQQFAEQLAEAHADLAGLPAELKAFGAKSLLPGEIERLQQAIAELGAVNLAALDELGIAQERKNYLDAQAADLTEALATLENAIRQIDKESRLLLQQTFETVNENFSRLFPALFGGGQARLVLTGEEILDSGVQVIAQPPGQAQHVDPPAVRRRKGADRDLARVRDVPAQPGAVLPARRGRRAARRSEHRPLLQAGARDVRADAVPLHHPQQDHDGDGEPAHRHHDGGGRRVAGRRRRRRRRARAHGRRRCRAIIDRSAADRAASSFTCLRISPAHDLAANRTDRRRSRAGGRRPRVQLAAGAPGQEAHRRRLRAAQAGRRRAARRFPGAPGRADAGRRSAQRSDRAAREPPWPGSRRRAVRTAGRHRPARERRGRPRGRGRAARRGRGRRRRAPPGDRRAW